MRSGTRELAPATRLRALQRRARGLTPKLRRGEAYHVELDAIATELGELALELEGYDPSHHVWHARPRARAAAAGHVAGVSA